MRKRILSIALCVVLCLSFSSCISDGTKCEECEAEFFNGYENGIQEVFLRVFDSSGNFETLFYGDTWDTDHFSLVLYDYIYEEEPYISYDITLKNTTIENCLEYDNFFFNIYATNGVTNNHGPYGEMVLIRDDFLWDGALYYDGVTDEYEQGNNVKSKCFLYNDLEYQNFLIIIATEGCLYSAVYYP